MNHHLLSDAAQASPAEPFLIGADRSYTYAQSAELADRAASALHRRGLARIACHAHDSPQLVLLLCACARAGIEICVLNRDDSPETVKASMARFELPVLIADSEIQASQQVIAIDALFAGGDHPPPTADDFDPRLLVLTSGTTGTPRGAWYTWGRLAAQVKRHGRWAGTRWLLAYRLNHFAGLHVLTHVLANRACLVVPASPSVDDAVASLLMHDVQCVSATPTFWRLLLSRLEPEQAQALPVRQITLGGEAVPPDLIGRLRYCFPAARISQMFATTEAGSCFSVRDERDGLPLSLLEPGADGLATVRIIDGELHVRCEHGMLGYHGEQPSAALAWRATGDLVELRGGRIHFIGRKSEVVNVGGVKVHPLPVEQCVCAVPGVLAAHCYGRKNPITGQALWLDVVPAPDADRARLEACIRNALDPLPRHSRPVLIRFVEQLQMVNRKVLRRSDE